MFRMKDLYKKQESNGGSEVESLFTLSNNSNLQVYYDFYLENVTEGNQFYADSPNISFKKQKKASENFNILMNLKSNYEKLEDNLTNTNTNSNSPKRAKCITMSDLNTLKMSKEISTEDSNLSSVNSSVQKPNVFRNSVINNSLINASTGYTSSTRKTNVSYASPDSDIIKFKKSKPPISSLKCDSSRNVIPSDVGIFSKPPVHKKNSAIAVVKNSEEDYNKKSYNRKLSYNESPEVKDYDTGIKHASADKRQSFKRIYSPGRGFTRKHTSTDIPTNLASIKLKDNKNIVTDHIELGYEDFFEFEVGDNFIEAIFIAGLPFTMAKPISDSEMINSCCEHIECNKIHAYKAEILGKFPGKGRSALQFTSIAASLCFTKGIKLCFANNQSQIPIIEDYMNMMTSETGERYYQYNYHFYAKFDIETFKNSFDIINNWFRDINITPDKYQSYSNFTLKDFVYVPYCICMVSKFPLTTQLNSCLKSLVSLVFKEREDPSMDSFDSSGSKILASKLNSGNVINLIEKMTDRQNLQLDKNKKADNDLINSFLKHVAYELPIPTAKELKSKKMKFYLPYFPDPIEISNQESEIPMIAYDLSLLFEYLSIENLIIIYHLLLHEQKLLFVSKSALTLSKILECVKMLIYPMVWVNTFIPVLSEDLIKFLQSFIPFIMGVEEGLFFLAKEHLDNHEGIYIVFVDKNIIETSQKPKRVYKKTLK